MRESRKPTDGRPWALLALLFTTVASGADVTSSLSADRKALRLSDPVHVTLAIEGDAPLRVELAPEVHDELSAAIWRARPDGPAHLVDLPNHRQRWTRTYRVDPYVPGDAVRLGFAPAQVFAGDSVQPKSATWPPLKLRVTTSATGDAAEARPPTGIEELPLIAAPPRPLGWWLAAMALLAVLLAGVARLLLRLLRRSAPTPTAQQSALLQLDELAVADATIGERLSETLRRFVAAATPVAATTLTTAELVSELNQAEVWPPERVAELAAVLDWCDGVKFAGRQPTDATMADMIATARRVIAPAPAFSECIGQRDGVN
jgi:hypothetical protein